MNRRAVKSKDSSGFLPNEDRKDLGVPGVAAI